MPATLTPEQVLPLAPDAAAARAAQKLAAPEHWPSLAYQADCLWGECRGSAREPYQVRVDLSGPAVKCSCPSHKQPCKHGLALLLLFAEQPRAFAGAQPPEWVSTWMNARAASLARRAAPPGSAVADPQAQANRVRRREARILAGLDELDLWLQDLARRGLASLATEPAGAWEALAARMVDAQAPGLARQLRELASLPLAGAEWSARLLERLGRLYLAIAGYRRLAQLPPETQADLRSLVGWTMNEDDLAGEPGVRDQWLVLSQTVTAENQLRVQRTWLWGRASQRAALLLDFAAQGFGFKAELPPAHELPAELVFYPSAFPLRAALRAHQHRYTPATGGVATGGVATRGWKGYPDLAAAAVAYAAALARQPWLERFPAPLEDVRPQPVGEQWWLRDSAGQGWRLQADSSVTWQMLALSGGGPMAVFGEWDGHVLRPLCVEAEGRLLPLSGELA